MTEVNRVELRVTFDEKCSFGSCSRTSVREFSSEDDFYDYLDNVYCYASPPKPIPKYTVQYRTIVETEWSETDPRWL